METKNRLCRADCPNHFKLKCFETIGAIVTIIWKPGFKNEKYTPLATRFKKEKYMYSCLFFCVCS